MKYDVTIGIPVYKAVDYIREAILSALNQTYLSIEYLVIDDCGNDGSINVIEQIKKIHPRGEDIRILRNERNMGVSYSRNRIIDEAKGVYLYFMDSDDTIEANTIQLLIDAVRNTHSQIAYASYEIIDLVNGSPIQKYQKDDIQIVGNGKLALYAFSHIDVFHISVCNFLISLEFLRQIGHRFIYTQYWEDMVFTTELVTRIDRAVLLSDITYHYLWRPNSLSHYQQREHFQKDEILKNIAVIKYLKEECKLWKDQVFTPYLCKNIEINSFYIACHIIKHAHRIDPAFTDMEIRDVLLHPLSLRDILKFAHLVMPNLFSWLLGRMPLFVFIPTIFLLGKFKKAI